MDTEREQRMEALRARVKAKKEAAQKAKELEELKRKELLEQTNVALLPGRTTSSADTGTDGTITAVPFDGPDLAANLANAADQALAERKKAIEQRKNADKSQRKPQKRWER